MKRREAILRFVPGSDPRRHRAAGAPGHRRPHRRRALSRHGPRRRTSSAGPRTRSRTSSRRSCRCFSTASGGGTREEVRRAVSSSSSPGRARAGLLAPPEEERPELGRAGAERAVDSPGRGRDAARRPRLRRRRSRRSTRSRARRSRSASSSTSALNNNPATREAWYFARAAAAEVGSKRSLYFPYVEVDGFDPAAETVGRRRAVHVHPDDLRALGRRDLAALQLRRAGGGSPGGDALSLCRRLDAQRRDPGRRPAGRAGVLPVPQREGPGRRRARRTSKRRRAISPPPRSVIARGSRRSPTCCSARTSASQAELALQVVQGQVQIVRGALATVDRRPTPTCPWTSASLPEELPLDAVQKSVDELIARAIAERPDLAAQQFRALAAESHIRLRPSTACPRFRSTPPATAPSITRPGVPDPFSTNWAGADSRCASPSSAASTRPTRCRRRGKRPSSRGRAPSAPRTRSSSTSGRATTASRRRRRRVLTTRDLLASAQQSADVAEGRYRAGVGNRSWTC